MTKIFDTEEEVLHAAADNLIEVANRSILHHGTFSLALSGGSTPKSLFHLLSSVHKETIDWSRVFFSLVMKGGYRSLMKRAIF